MPDSVLEAPSVVPIMIVLDQPHLLTGFDYVWLGARAQLAKAVEGFEEIVMVSSSERVEASR
jgi:hypothetical protein